MAGSDTFFRQWKELESISPISGIVYFTKRTTRILLSWNILSSYQGEEMERWKRRNNLHHYSNAPQTLMVGAKKALQVEFQVPCNGPSDQFCSHLPTGHYSPPRVLSFHYYGYYSDPNMDRNPCCNPFSTAV